MKMEEKKLIKYYMNYYTDENSILILSNNVKTIDFIKNKKKLFKIIILNNNYQFLENLVDVLIKNKISKIQLIYPESIIGFEDEFKKLVPKIEDSQQYIQNATNKIKENNLKLVSNKYLFNYKKPNYLLKGYLKIKPIYETLEKLNEIIVSVIILTANRKEYLLKVLDSFKKQSNLKNKNIKFEVIIVDDNSNDGTIDVIKLKEYQFRLVYIYWPRDKKFTTGKAENRAGPARNLGAKFSKGKILVFIDGDIIVNPNFINEHYKLHIETKIENNNYKKGIVVIGPAIREKEQEDVREKYFILCNDKIEKLPIPWAMLHSGNFSVFKKDFIDIGMFDSDFVYWGMEDDEIGYRFSKQGYKIILNRKAYGIHLWHPTEYIDIDNKNYGDQYNATVFYKKHLDSEIYKYHLTKLDLNLKCNKRKYINLNLTNNCNNNCVYCKFLGKRNKLIQSNQDIEQKIIASVNTKTKLLISGGESTVSKNFFEVLGKIKNAKIKDVELVTNARAFSYKNFTEKVINYGVNNFLVTIFGHNSKQHDKITQVKGSFNQTILGIKNLLSFNVNVSIHIVINGLNFTLYKKIINHFKKLGVINFQLTVIPPEHDSMNNFKREDFVNFVKKALFEFENKDKLKLRNDFFSCLKEQKCIDALNDTHDMKKCLFCSFINDCRGNPTNIFNENNHKLEKKVIFFRDDDVSELTSKLKRLIGIFIEEKVPVSLEVIPKKLTNETVDYLLNLKKKYPYLIDINQHGYSHKNNNDQTNEELYEFGKNRSYEEQFNDIKEGKKIMEKKFGKNFSLIFTPPFNEYDENTVTALQELKFKAISADNSGFITKGIKTANSSIDLIESYSPKIMFHTKDNIKLQLEIAINKLDYTGILLHHEFFGEEQFEFLHSLIKYIKKEELVQFKTISQIINPKVLLIQPKFHQKSALVCEPTGLLSLAAYLESNGIEVKIFDMNLQGNNQFELQNFIKQFNPKYIGLTGVTSQILNAYEISRLIKQNFPDKIIFFGGVHSTFLPQEPILQGKADYVIFGEGEISVIQLINVIEKGGSVENINGIAYKKGSEIIKNQKRDFICNLDKLPFPAYHLVPIGLYRTSECMVPGLKKKAVHVMTSRGCSNNCSYCASPKLYHRTVRFRSIDNVISEIEFIKKIFGIRWVHFHDDNFLLDYNRVKELCDQIINKNIIIKWTCLANVTTIVKHPEIIPLMKKAGCVGIEMGVESGDENVFKSINKNQNLEIIKEASDLIKKADIEVFYLMMCYNLGENIDTPFKSMKFIHELTYGKLDSENKPDFKNINLMSHLTRASPGCDFYEVSQKKGKILTKSWNDHYEENIGFIPNSFLYDIPKKLRYFSKEKLKKYLNSNEKIITFLIENHYYTAKEIIFKDFKSYEEFFNFMIDIFLKCDSEKTVYGIAKEINYNLKLVVSAISMLSLLRIIGSWQEKHIRYLEQIKESVPMFSLPKQVRIKLTKKCNLRCTMCKVYKIEEDNKLSYEILSDILRQLKKLGIKTISLSGGEPTLYPEIEKVINLINDLDMKGFLFTNGTFLTEELCKQLMKNDWTVQLSIDGFNNEIQDKIRGKKGTFQKIINTLKLLDKYRGIYKLGSITSHTIIFDDNYDKLEKMVDFLGKVKIDVYEFAIISPFDIFKNKNKFIKLCKTKKSYKKIIPFIRGIDYLGKYIEKQISYKDCLDEVFSKKNLTCFPFDEFLIGPDAKVYTCCVHIHEEKLCFGDLTDNSFKEIWFGKKHLNLKQKLTKLNPNLCSGCHRLFESIKVEDYLKKCQLI
jgi:anaerobic magnesium-protoporphyrin IX monomethyl ester cyclase